MDATGTRGSALPTIGRVALIALGAYVLLVSIVPLLELLRSANATSGASPVPLDGNQLLLDLTLWTVYPAAVLMLAG